MNVRKENMEIKNCVWFNSEDIFNELVTLSHVDIAFKLKLETYKDRYQYKMYIEDIQLPKNEENINKKYLSLYTTTFPLETVIYTRKKPDTTELKLMYQEDEVDVTYNRNYLSTLDPQTSYLLLQLKKYYNYDFKVTIKDIILKDENYNVHLIIDKEYNFNSYSIKQGELFKDIKNFLLGDFNYNSMQKNCLASIFKEKKNTLLIAKMGRGINTIIQTIGLYYKSLDGKVLYITDNIPPKKTMNIVDISENFQEGYDFYIVDKKINHSLIENKKSLVMSQENIDINNFNKIIDSYSIPNNIVFIEDDILEKKNIFANFLPIEERKRILKTLNSSTTILSSKEILSYL